MKSLFVAAIFFFSSISLCKTTKIEDYVGNWALLKGEQNVCPESFQIKKVAKGKIEVANIRPGATGKMIFEKGKTLQGKASTHYSKKKMPVIRHDYTLHTNYTTAFINGRLVSSHLWVIPEIPDGTSTATKIISKKNKKTIILEKVLTGYGTPKMDPSVKKEYSENTFAKHDNNFSLGTIGFRCEFKKQKSTIQK